MKLPSYRHIVKRLLDILVAAVAIMVLCPVFISVAIAVAWKFGRPILFTQLRPGFHGRLFRLIKFRTMTHKRAADGSLLPDAERLTRFGRLLRSSSLDELPELWNVLKGDMSLVGPRPLLEEYLPVYTSFQARRHNVRPGITGLAQVSGRNELEWERRLELDVWYADNVSLRLDSWILLKTLIMVFSRRGIAMPGHATMPKFTGSDCSANHP